MTKNRKLASCILTVFCGFLVLGWAPEEEKGGLKPVPDHMKKGFESIKPVDSSSYLEFIAADELEGRDTATRGLTIARKYIMSLYKTWGVKPAGDWKGESENKKRSFEQRMDMLEVHISDETRLEIQSGPRHARFEWGEDFTGGSGVTVPGTLEAPAVFAGYGLSAPDLGYDDFRGIDVRNKIVITCIGTPGGDRPDSPFNKPENRARFAGRYTPAEKCARLLARKGALTLLIIDEEIGRVDNAGEYKEGAWIPSARRRVEVPLLSSADPMVPFFWASPSIADTLFAGSGRDFRGTKQKIDREIKPQSVEFDGSRVCLHLDIERKPTVSANLLGIVEGSDPELSKEYVLLGAHLDHVGMNEDGYVFNGADDNGSGSVGILQVAKALVLNPIKPKRSILLAHWTGEEQGLLGSRFFVAYPPIPMADIVACINLDMICRDTTLESIIKDAGGLGLDRGQLSSYPDEPERLVAALTSSPSALMAEAAVKLGAEHCGLVVVPLPSFPMLANSDHFPFAQRNVPSVFFNTEDHRDLHQPSDTVEKINAEKMSRIVRLAYLLAFSIADAPEAPRWQKGPDDK